MTKCIPVFPKRNLKKTRETWARFENRYLTPDLKNLMPHPSRKPPNQLVQRYQLRRCG